MDLELISFKLCPFVQSSVITALHKNIPYKTTFIDINDPPAWFDEISPTGQVPVLKVDNGAVIFESAVINEYLNTISDGGMLPDDPVDAALTRSWSQFGASIFGDMFNLVGAEDESSVEDIEYDILEKLDRVEAIKKDGPYFNGDAMHMIDAYFAGIFMRLNLLKPARDILDAERFPKLSAWSEHLMSLDEVKDSVVPEFAQMYTGMVKMRGGFLASQIEN